MVCFDPLMRSGNGNRRPARTGSPRRSARAQLSLVEHALCPLDTSTSLQPNSLFESCYFFSDQHRNRRRANARVAALDGLSAHDELYLWGLISLALDQAESRPEFMATPYYCLRRLGLVSSTRKGGTDFSSFRSALKRLAGVRYQNDHFYDPVRGEHREVSFGFLNYSLPLGDDTSRAWRFAWDPIFFELCQATGGALAFDLATYRKLDAASRRLYLFLKKLFWRNSATPEIDVRHLAVDVLGFADSIEMAHLKRKLARCIEQLADLQIVQPSGEFTRPADLFNKRSKGVYSVRLERGPKFDARGVEEQTGAVTDSPLYEPLKAIGFDNRSIQRLVENYPARLIEEWADITLAAIERNGPEFFKVSPQAYFVDNMKAASEGCRTPPDWWRDLRRQEQAMEREQSERKAALTVTSAEDQEFEQYLQDEAREVFVKVTSKLVTDLQSAGQSEAEAQSNAEYTARMHLRNRFRREHAQDDYHNGIQSIGDFLQRR